MTAADKEARECLQKVINGNIPEMDISIGYEENENPSAEAGRDTKVRGITIDLTN